MGEQPNLRSPLGCLPSMSHVFSTTQDATDANPSKDKCRTAPGGKSPLAEKQLHVSGADNSFFNLTVKLATDKQANVEV